jgi:integrase
MALNKLTDRDFRNLKAEEKVRSYPDGGGLMLRIRSISEGGASSFMFSYRIDGKQYRITLKANTLASARRERDVYKDLVKQGKNPIIERKLEIHRANQKQLEEQQHIAKLNARMNVNGLFELWVKTDLINRKDLPEIRRVFGKEVLPSLGGCLVEDVKKGDIAIIIAQLKQRGVVHMARNLLKLLRQMLKFAVSYDLIEFDPSSSLSIAKMTTTPTERDRVLSAEEITALAKQLPSAGLLRTTECAVWVCLSTMCRIGELSKAKISDIDLDAGTWTIPKENSKNGKAHTIYLSKFALAQFTTLLSYTTHPVWVFPNRGGTSNVCEKSITKQLISRQTDIPLSNRSKDSQALVLAGGKWTSHDLRRTGATMMGELGIPPDVIEKCLNHTEANKIKRIYQRQKLDAEQRHAWGVLGERLNLLVNAERRVNSFDGKQHRR